MLFFEASGTPGYPRPSLIPSRDGPLGLHHPDLLGRPYADQLAHQVIFFLFLFAKSVRCKWQ